MRVEVLTDRPEERFGRGATLYPEGSEAALTVAEARPVADGPGWWIRFREVRDRAAAEPLRDAYLEADVEPASLAEGEVWWHEVVGTPVTDTAGGTLGVVADIYRAGGAEVLVVREGPLGELDVPNVATIVRDFEPRAGRIVVDLEALDPERPAPAHPRGRRTTRAAAAGTLASQGEGSPAHAGVPDESDQARPGGTRPDTARHETAGADGAGDEPPARTGTSVQ